MAGPGCGVEAHPTTCLCDVVIPKRKPRKAKRSTQAKAEIDELIAELRWDQHRK